MHGATTHKPALLKLSVPRTVQHHLHVRWPFRMLAVVPLLLCGSVFTSMILDFAVESVSAQSLWERVLCGFGTLVLGCVVFRGKVPELLYTFIPYWWAWKR